MLAPAAKTFMYRLITKINEQDTERTGHLRQGSAQDFADYRERSGYLRALDDVREWCKEIAEAEED